MLTRSQITSRDNPRVKQLRGAFSGNARLAQGLIAIEGETLLGEALRSGLALRTVFLAGERNQPSWLPAKTEVLRLSAQVFSSAVETETPQGIAAVLSPPAWELEAVLRATSTDAKPVLLLVAAGLQDPGNLGTLVRSAEAFGASAVLTTPKTVSPWNPKALRASAGSVFRLPVISLRNEQFSALSGFGIGLFAAVAADSAHHDSPAVPIMQVDLTRPCAVMIGNEGSGLTPDLLALADTRISIPTPGPVESLNAAVAGSVLLYEAARQRATVRTGS